MRAYARTPIRVQPVKSELLLRLLIGDLVGDEVTRAAAGSLRDDVADLEGRLAEVERGAESLPHRRVYLLMVTGFLRGLLDLHLQLVDQVERELAPTPRTEAPESPPRPGS